MDSWRSIARFHVQTRGWIGIGYHVGVNRDGTIVQLADLNSWRAHIAGQNDRYVGIAILGDFSTEAPPASQLEGTRAAIAWIRETYPEREVMPHTVAALPGYGTECPGSIWREWWGKLAA